MEIRRFYVDRDMAYAYLVNKGRGCWYGHKLDDINVSLKGFISYYDLSKNEGKEAILEIVNHNGFDPAKLPYIEDADPLLKGLYDNISQSENNMWFVVPEDIDTEFISREEYESRVDAAIKKYHLENVITKNEDGALYTCYGNLQSMFSEAAE
jgi:hypothetical protein